MTLATSGDALAILGELICPYCGVGCRLRFEGRPGHPVAFAAELLPALRALDGDRGARALLDAQRERVVEVPVADAGIHADIDTVADLLRVGALGQQ